MAKWTPDRKLLGSGLGGIVAYGAIKIAVANGVVLDVDDVALIEAFIMTVVGYFTPPSANDILARLDENMKARLKAGEV